MFSRPCPTLVEPVKVTEVGVAMVMITADRSHSAAMARLSLPSASGWAGSGRLDSTPAQQSVQQQADQQHRDDAIGAILISRACLDAPDRHR